MEVPEIQTRPEISEFTENKLGGNVTVCPGVTIGDRVIVAAGSVVVHDVPDDVLVAGNPAVIKRHL